MIAWVCNVPLAYAAALVLGVHPLGAPPPPKEHRLAWLGLVDPGVESPLCKLRALDPQYVWHFPDPALPPRDSQGLSLLHELPHRPRVEPELVAELTRYLHHLHASEKRYALWIHCHAGVARSGAVAQWCHEVFGAVWPSGTSAGRDHARPSKPLLHQLYES